MITNLISRTWQRNADRLTSRPVRLPTALLLLATLTREILSRSPHAYRRLLSTRCGLARRRAARALRVQRQGIGHRLLPGHHPTISDADTDTDSDTDADTDSDTDTDTSGDTGDTGPTFGAAVNDATFRDAVDVVATADTVYAAGFDDAGNAEVVSIALSGGAVTVLTSGSPLVMPSGISLSADGNTVYVSDVGADAGATNGGVYSIRPAAEPPPRSVRPA